MNPDGILRLAPDVQGVLISSSTILLVAPVMFLVSAGRLLIVPAVTHLNIS
jgi:hypothetical protein